jgi:hypothetical protein
MADLWDSFWRAVAYCLHPRVVLWSLLPLLLAGLLVGGLGAAHWESGVASVRAALEQWALVGSLLDWLASIGAGQLRSLLAPMLIVALSLPVVAMVSLLLVALLVAPAVVRLVAERRFPGLRALHASPWWHSPLWALACAAAALAALVLSIPLWFVPPLVLVLPPLIWGWLTCRVLSFEVLAQHATAAERRILLRRRRWPLLLMGMVCGFLGTLPSVVWTLGPLALAFAPVLILVAVWLYTLVFAFAACWFAHYALADLQRLRDSIDPSPGNPDLPPTPGANPP